MLTNIIKAVFDVNFIALNRIHEFFVSTQNYAHFNAVQGKICTLARGHAIVLSKLTLNLCRRHC